MSGKYNIFHGQFVKHTDGSLQPAETCKAKYKLFLQDLEPGQTVGIFFEANEDDGTLDQLAKIHACIRELSMHSGEDFVEMKKTIKRNSGLCVRDAFGEEKFKSFADCSKKELGFVIEAIFTAGDFMDINFR